MFNEDSESELDFYAELSDDRDSDYVLDSDEE